MTKIELTVIALMTIATYVTRAGGLWLVGLIDMTPRIQRSLHYLSGSVLAALVIPTVLRGDAGVWVGVAAGCAVILATRRSAAALVAGTVAAALIR